jgi:hypothetical protein
MRDMSTILQCRECPKGDEATAGRKVEDTDATPSLRRQCAGPLCEPNNKRPLDVRVTCDCRRMLIVSFKRILVYISPKATAAATPSTESFFDASSDRHPGTSSKSDPVRGE